MQNAAHNLVEVSQVLRDKFGIQVQVSDEDVISYADVPAQCETASMPCNACLRTPAEFRQVGSHVLTPREYEALCDQCHEEYLAAEAVGEQAHWLDSHIPAERMTANQPWRALERWGLLDPDFNEKGN
jgi:hypothetical protein